MTHYRVMIRNLYTGTTTARDQLYTFDRAQREIREINEHYPNHEAWMEEILMAAPRDRVIGLLVCSLTCAAVWGTIGALIGGTTGAAVGVFIGGSGAAFAYALVAGGSDAPPVEAAPFKDMEDRGGPRRRAA